MVEVQQVFDVAEDSLAKQKLLSNAVYVLHCTFCGYQGMLALPIVYHDPNKELLLTFFPPDLKTPINEQEKQIGPLINRIIDRMPQEKRKAYLLQPQNMLTYQTLVEKVLEADGITKEMIEEQQKKVRLLERLLTTPKEDRVAIIKQEEDQFDLGFFSIFSSILQSVLDQGDEASKNELVELQQQLYENTKVGKELKQLSRETENALKSLQEAGKEGLTREKLLEVILNAKTDTEISTIVGLTHSGMDYIFFQLLSEKIEAASNDEEKHRLLDLREKLLKQIEEINNQIKTEMNKSKDNLEKILQAENIEEEVTKNPEVINDFFIQNLQNEIAYARQKGDLERLNKLDQLMGVIEKYSAPLRQIKLLETMLEIEDETALDKLIEERQDELTDDFISLLNNIIAEYEKSAKDVNLLNKLKLIYRKVLRISMRAKIKE